MDDDNDDDNYLMMSGAHILLRFHSCSFSTKAVLIPWNEFSWFVCEHSNDTLDSEFGSQLFAERLLHNLLVPLECLGQLVGPALFFVLRLPSDEGHTVSGLLDN